LINAYNVAQLERKDLIEANVPRGNPAVQEKEAMTETLRQRILSSLSNVRKAITTSISDLQSKNATVQAQLRSLPAKQQNYLEIQREQQTKQAVYNLLLEKNEESAIALAATISNSKVLEQAMPNGTPVKPNRRNTQLLALFIGFLLPGLFILGVEVLNDKVTTRNDIERITTATILGEVGHSYSNETLVVKSNNRSVVAEQFRIIRSNLQYVLSNIQKPVILVTSSFSGEGKSFVSTNIGAVMALTGKKTIILEFDIRKPKILSQLNMGKKPGVTNYLIGKASLEDLPIPVPETENLYVLPCGPVPPNPAELLLESRLNDLIAYLKNNFDVIVMDTAPVGMVSDAMTLSKFADCTLYIVRQGYTYKRQIALIDEFHQQKKLPRISLVVNDVKAHGGYGYYGYGKYGYGGYGYGYTSGYFDDDTPPPTLLSKWFGWMDIKKWKKNKAKRRRR
jgi:capsular exopolysaccharide synthesis family protein